MELKGPASLSWILGPGADGEEKRRAAVFLKGMEAQALMLGAFPLAFARPVLCGLQRMGFPCLLLGVCHK